MKTSKACAWRSGEQNVTLQVGDKSVQVPEDMVESVAYLLHAISPDNGTPQGWIPIPGRCDVALLATSSRIDLVYAGEVASKAEAIR